MLVFHMHLHAPTQIHRTQAQRYSHERARNTLFQPKKVVLVREDSGSLFNNSRDAQINATSADNRILTVVTVHVLNPVAHCPNFVVI